jgi:hypothetical protein
VQTSYLIYCYDVCGVVYSIVYSYFSGTVYEARMLQKCYYQSVTSLVLYIDRKQMQSEGEVSKR